MARQKKNLKVESKDILIHAEWYDQNITTFKSLAEIIAATLKIALQNANISFVNIPYRHKEKVSFLKKIEDKKYTSIDKMTDLAGIRVITLVESDVAKVSQLIKDMFNIHTDDSVNKSASLGEDKVGYRSVHFVCDIGLKREELPEFSSFKNLCFEIQVRTALEHAWAEIEHDRGYKLGGGLPSHLKRRFALLSGMLESADLEFNRLTAEIEEYAKTIKTSVEAGENLDYELTSVGVHTYLNTKYPILKFDGDINDPASSQYFDREIIEELSWFNVCNIQDLDGLIKPLYPELKDNSLGHQNLIGFLRDVMLLTDIDKYFGSDNKNKITWGFMTEKDYSKLVSHYGAEKIDSILKENDIDIVSDDAFDEN